MRCGLLACALTLLAFVAAGAAAGGGSDPVAEAAGPRSHLSPVPGLPQLEPGPDEVARQQAREHRAAVVRKRLRARRRAAARRAAAARAGDAERFAGAAREVRLAERATATAAAPR